MTCHSAYTNKQFRGTLPPFFSPHLSPSFFIQTQHQHLNQQSNTNTSKDQYHLTMKSFTELFLGQAFSETQWYNLKSIDFSKFYPNAEGFLLTMIVFFHAKCFPISLNKNEWAEQRFVNLDSHPSHFLLKFNVTSL